LNICTILVLVSVCLFSLPYGAGNGIEYFLKNFSYQFKYEAHVKLV
jgi:hypothetical protein